MSKHSAKRAQAHEAAEQDQDMTSMDNETAPQAAPQEETSMALAGGSGATSYADRLAALPLVPVRFNQMGDLTVNLPRRYAAGYTLQSDGEALILDMAIVRQFTNNLNANAKARDGRLSKALAAGDAEGIKENQPYTEAEVRALFEKYQPNVGGAPRESALQKLHREAAWRVWSGLVTRHNKSLLAGTGPVITAAGNARMELMRAPKKGTDIEGKPCSDEAHEAALEAFTEIKNGFLDQLLASPKYAEAVQEAIDAITAERKATKGGKDAQPAPAVSLSNMASLL